MNNSEASSYRHRRHDDMAALVQAGKTDTDIALQLKVGRRAVARVRRMLGIPPMTVVTSLEDKLKLRVIDLPDGHTGWTGNRNTEGNAPIIIHCGRQYPAAAIAFKQRTGRDPVGMCRADCDVQHCLTPSHILDDIERRTQRLQLKALMGEQGPWIECSKGHPWDEHGRVDPRLRLYCKTCSTGRKQQSRAGAAK